MEKEYFNKKLQKSESTEQNEKKEVQIKYDTELERKEIFVKYANLTPDIEFGQLKELVKNFKKQDEAK